MKKGKSEIDRHPPGWSWYVWSAVNNEQFLIISSVLIAWLLTAAASVIISLTANFNLPPGLDRNETLYASVLFTPLADLVKPIENNQCEIDTTANPVDLFTTSNRLSAWTWVAVFLLLLTLMTISVAAFESFNNLEAYLGTHPDTSQRKLLVVIAFAWFLFLCAAFTGVVHNGLGYYKVNRLDNSTDPFGGQCWLLLVDYLQNSLFDEPTQLSFQNDLNANRAAEIIVITTGVLGAICIALYVAMLCSPRRWADTTSWNSRQNVQHHV